MSHSLVYITAGDREEAIKVGRALVQARLAACANILGEITSVFWWEDGVTEDTEVNLIVKTRTSLVDQVTELVRQVHSYDCPCVVAVPIQAGNPGFLSWIDDETAEAAGEPAFR